MLQKSLPVGVTVLLVAAAGCISEPSTEEQTDLGQIDGALLDQLLNPYRFANVTLVELGLTDTTTYYGGFSFVDVPPGKYRIYADPEGGEPVTASVIVREQQLKRVIVQSWETIENKPHVATVSKIGRGHAVAPGFECTTCSWKTTAYDGLEEVVVRAQWNSTLDGNLRIKIVDSTNRLLFETQGKSPIHANFDARDMHIPNDELVLKVYYGADMVPQPDFVVQTNLELYYWAGAASF